MVCSVVAGSFISTYFFPAKLSVDLRRELVLSPKKRAAPEKKISNHHHVAKSKPFFHFIFILSYTVIMPDK
jgi:hypothetical protein